MGGVDPRLVDALEAQLAHRREALARGATHVGWKLGMGDRESIGGEHVIGYLTSETVLEPDASYRPDPRARLDADVEVALELRRDVAPDEDAREVAEAVARVGVALELVDLSGTDDPESIVAANVFHRAVAFGPFRPAVPDSVLASLVVDGAIRARGRAARDVVDRICIVARLLDVVGERLRAGDRIITGSVVQAPVRSGGHVVADLGELGRVGLTIA